MNLEKIPNNEVQEFLAAVQKEIKAKEIHETILLELYHHIEDAASSNMENGFTKEEAWHFALISMGDASQIGKELNQTHQKRNPLFPLLIIGISFLIALLGNLKTPRPYGIPHHFQRNQFLYLTYGGLLLLFFIKSGSFIFKHRKGVFQVFWGIWGIYGFAWGITRFFQTFHIDGDFLYPCYFLVNRAYTTLYAFSLLSIVMLAYYESFLFIQDETTERNMGVYSKMAMISKLKISCYSMLLFSIICFLDQHILGAYGLSAVFILTLSFIGVILFSDRNCLKVKCGKVACALGIFCLFYLPFIQSEFTTYQRETQAARSNSDLPFRDNMQIQSLLKKAQNWGMADISAFRMEVDTQLEDILPQYYQIDYRIAYWILKYGIFPAAFLLIGVLTLYFILWKATQTICNRTYRLFAYACFFCLILQFVLYFIGNLGFQFTWFCNFPIISEGISSITGNILLIGVILIFYRYDRVLTIQFSHSG